MIAVNGHKKPLVLIVDDVQENLRVIGSMLKEAGYALSIALQGYRALKIAASIHPDIIILDVQMPGIDGYEVCRMLKNNTETESIPVLFLTARNDSDEIVRGFDAGAVDYVTKPFNQRELLTRIKTQLELKLAREKIEQMSFYDELSGIPNKRYFNDIIEVEWKKAVRDKTEIALIMIDIDDFKLFNDTYGHINGDACIHAVAKTIKSCLQRPGDFAARFGGEEFVCVLPDTDIKGGLFVAEKVRKSVMDLKLKHEKSSTAPFVTVSLGVSSLSPKEDSDLISFINNTDRALYRSKYEGKNRVVYVA